MQNIKTLSMKYFIWTFPSKSFILHFFVIILHFLLNSFLGILSASQFK